MRSPTLALTSAAVLLAGLAASTPAPISSSSSTAIAPDATTLPFTYNPSVNDTQACDDSTFTTITGVIPADWSDCAALYSAFAANNGTFVVRPFANDAVFVPILKSGTCTLAIKANVTGEGPYTIGDVDVGKILDGALLNFSSGSSIAAQGDVMCPDGDGVKRGLHWQISDCGI
ncbi:hypothetical protein G7046_g6612 [Stylonectria norvegica]|nr:hypothetical protein G7046_g6612 [Stylonectria norvegica]